MRWSVCVPVWDEPWESTFRVAGLPALERAAAALGEPVDLVLFTNRAD